jgi:hypothetical protein
MVTHMSDVLHVIPTAHQADDEQLIRSEDTVNNEHNAKQRTRHNACLITFPTVRSFLANWSAIALE